MQQFFQLQPWWPALGPWFQVTPALIVIFLLGMIYADWLNPSSWLRSRALQWGRIFEVENVVAAHHTSPPNTEWIEITAHLRFVRETEAQKVSIRVVANLGIPARRVFSLPFVSPDRVVRDERFKIVLATLPLQNSSGQPQPTGWGKVGPGQAAETFFDRTESVVEISARSWRGKQTSRIYVRGFKEIEDRRPVTLVWEKSNVLEVRPVE